MGALAFVAVVAIVCATYGYINKSNDFADIAEVEIKEVRNRHAY